MITTQLVYSAVKKHYRRNEFFKVADLAEKMAVSSADIASYVSRLTKAKLFVRKGDQRGQYTWALDKIIEDKDYSAYIRNCPLSTPVNGKTKSKRRRSSKAQDSFSLTVSYTTESQAREAAEYLLGATEVRGMTFGWST